MNHSAFSLLAAENKKKRQASRAADKEEQRRKQAMRMAAKKYEADIRRHHNALIKTAYRAEARGVQAEWEDAIAAIANHQQKHPRLNLPGHLGEELD